MFARGVLDGRMERLRSECGVEKKDDRETREEVELYEDGDWCGVEIRFWHVREYGSSGAARHAARIRKRLKTN